MASETGIHIQLTSMKSTDGEFGDRDVENNLPPAYEVAASGLDNNAFAGEDNEKNRATRTTPEPAAVIEEQIPNRPLAKVPDEKRENEDTVSGDSSDEEDEFVNKVGYQIAKGRKIITDTYDDHSRVLGTLFWVLIGLAYLVYFCWVLVKYFDKDDEGDIRLVWVTSVVVLFIVVHFIPKNFWKKVNCGCGYIIHSETRRAQKIRSIIYWCLVIATCLFIVTFVIIDVAIERPANLISGLGMIVFVTLFYVCSYRPAKVRFQPVFWGLALQFYFALLILRTNAGYTAFQWLGKRVGEFLDHTDAGSKFVFGDDYVRHFFALKVLMVVVFFSAFISMMYYLGVMQFVIRNIARFLSVCLGTSPTESLNTAGNIFVSQSEAPLLIRPFLNDMTRSEIHAVCTGGFATIAGANLAAYTAMGAPANHLLSATVMSAPAALAMAKLFWPETKKTRTKAEDVYKMQERTEHNVIEAACNGASISIKLIANIAVNLVAFIALLELINTALMWFGYRINMTDPPLTFQFICSYVFYPIAWLMGSTSGDIRKVASLIATKTFINEYVAYGELGVYIANRVVYDEWTNNDTALHNMTYYIHDDLYLGNETVLKGGILSDRSVVISTYALCGFSNISSIGIMIGALSAMAPARKKDITKVVVRAMIAGNVACFMTACIAGLLYKGPM